MTNLRNLFLTVAALAILPGAAARADSIAINFMPSILSAAPGQTVTFSGTITNLENATVDLNSCDVNLAGPFTTDSCVDFPALCATFSGAPRDQRTVRHVYSHRQPAVHRPVRITASRHIYSAWRPRRRCPEYLGASDLRRGGHARAWYLRASWTGADHDVSLSVVVAQLRSTDRVRLTAYGILVVSRKCHRTLRRSP